MIIPAERVHFALITPDNWDGNPADVAKALEELAGRIRTDEGKHPSSSTVNAVATYADLVGGLQNGTVKISGTTLSLLTEILAQGDLLIRGVDRDDGPAGGGDVTIRGGVGVGAQGGHVTIQGGTGSSEGEVYIKSAGGTLLAKLDETGIVFYDDLLTTGLIDTRDVAALGAQLDLLPPSILSAYKPAATAISNDATLSDDPDLTVSLAANTTYIVDGFFITRSTTNADFKWSWTKPTGAVLRAEGIYQYALSTTDYFYYDLGGTQVVVVPGTGYGFVRVIGTVKNGANAGAFTLRWAQNTSHADTTAIYKGSYLTAKGI